jgi:hypothetical protein
MLHVYAETHVLNDSVVEKRADSGGPTEGGAGSSGTQLKAPGIFVRQRLSPPRGVALVSDFVDLTMFKGFRAKYGPVLLRQMSAERHATELTPLPVQPGSGPGKEMPCQEFRFEFARLRCELEVKKARARARENGRGGG